MLGSHSPPENHPIANNSVQYFSVVAGVAILSGLSLPLASYTVFRDYTYSKDVISVNNRFVSTSRRQRRREMASKWCGISIHGHNTPFSRRL